LQGLKKGYTFLFFGTSPATGFSALLVPFLKPEIVEISAFAVSLK
jgi:hypothetical protein